MRTHKPPALVSAALLTGAAFVAAPASRIQTQPAEPPAVVAAAAPAYPAIAAAARAGGEVLVEVKVNNAGDVSTAKARSGHPLLRRAGEAAARRWKFAPAEGSNDPRTARLTFVFKLFEERKGESAAAAVFFPPYRVEVTHTPAESGSRGNPGAAH